MIVVVVEPGSGGTSVDMQDQRWRCCVIMMEGPCHDSINEPAIDALIANPFGLCQRQSLFMLWIQARETLPGDVFRYTILIGQFTQPDIMGMLFDVGGYYVAQIRCYGYVRPVSFTQYEIVGQRRHCSCCNIKHGYLAGEVFKTSTKQMFAIGEPVAPGWTPIKIWRQIARLVAGERDGVDVTAIAIRVAPVSRNVGESISVGRPGQRTGLTGEITELEDCPTISGNQTNLPPVPIRII